MQSSSTSPRTLPYISLFSMAQEVAVEKAIYISDKLVRAQNWSGENTRNFLGDNPLRK